MLLLVNGNVGCCLVLAQLDVTTHYAASYENSFIIRNDWRGAGAGLLSYFV